VARRRSIIAATKAVPGAAAPTPAPQGGTYFGALSPLMHQLNNERGYTNTYGPFLPRPENTFTEGAFGPFSPILPVPVDAPAEGADQPDPRLYEYQVGWNLPVGQPGTEGLKLADFNTLRTLANLYSVARTCIQIRKSEIRGLDWDIVPTHEAAKAYQNDHAAMRDFGERRGEAVKFFRQPDPDFFNFGSWLDTLLDEVFVYDALSLVLRPKRGKGLGRGLLGSDLDCIELVSGPTIRPLVGMHGEIPRPPAPAYQQYLYGVPRSDYMTMITQRDVDEGGLMGAEGQAFTQDQLLYLPMLRQRWTPYGMPPIERALIPVMSGLQKQGFQLDYYREGTVPAVYISPGDPNITPNQIRELQDALNAIAGDPAWHHKIIVLPPGSKVEPQRPVDLADEFDEMVMTQVCMAFDVNPIELGILPNVSSGGSPFAAREMAQASRNIHERVSTKPTLKFLCAIFDEILHRVCGQDDMKFTFEGLQEEEDQAAVTDLLVKQVQYGIRSVDEARGEIELPPWGLPETTEPVVFTQMGPVPFQQAFPLIQQQAAPNQPASGSSSSSSSGSKPNKPNKATSTTGRGDQYGGPGQPRHGKPVPLSTKPNGGELPPSNGKTPAHSAAEGHQNTQSLKPGGGTPSQNARRAQKAELESLGRHLKKGRDITTWKAIHLPGATMAGIEEDLDKGLSIDEVVNEWLSKGVDDSPKVTGTIREWPGWSRDLGLIGRYVEIIRDAFSEAEGHAGQLRESWAKGHLAITQSQYKDLVGDEVEKVIESSLIPLWKAAWDLGYESAESLLHGDHEPRDNQGRDAFIATQGKHWAQHIARTGIRNALVRSEMIARTEVARAQSAAALECYRKYGVSYKHLLVAPDDVCEKCRADEEAGVIPLNAAFPSGDLGAPVHVNCRCMPAPAGINVTPPLAHLGKAHGPEDDTSRVSFLLIRARNHEGKWRYLLQKRGEDINNSGEWGLPGGTCHHGEDSWTAAIRECHEEMGDMPPMKPRMLKMDPREDHMVHTYLVEIPEMFNPSADGKTSEEISGWGWFSRKEIKHLNLHKGFERTWEDLPWEDIGKARRVVDLNGQEVILEDDDDGPDWPAAGGGAPLPRPHDADGNQVVEPPPGSKPGSEPPRWGGAGVPPIVRENDIANFPNGRGRAPNGVGKNASDLSVPNHVDTEHVMNQMRKNYPEKAIQWMNEAKWIGPVGVPLDTIDFDDEDKWAASHELDAVARFADGIKANSAYTHPVIMVKKPGNHLFDVIDGHHRTLAYRSLERPVKAYIGYLNRDQGPWDETHSSQFHHGDDPQNKSAETPIVSTVHHPLGEEGLWHTPDRHTGEKEQLPAYIQNIAHALMRDQGMEESRAIATAINAVKRWAKGDLHWGKRKVTPEVQAAARRALAEWEKLRAVHGG
jgi:8-oxo-dGTP pyrophosphatase MutT (NUDIX family)